MQKDATSTKFVARRRLGLFIATVIALAAIIYWFYAWRTDTLLTAPGKSTVASTLYKARSPLNSVVEIVIAAPAPPPTKSLPGESSWKAILENLAALLKPDKVEVCGLSDFDATLFIAGDTEVGVAAVNTTLAQVTGKLVDSEQLRERALGLYMQAHLAEWAWRNAEQSKYRMCDGDMECIGKKMSTPQTPPAPAPETRSVDAAPLVALARSSRDPSIVAAALYACRDIQTDACKSISATDWAAIEPNNAAAWLKVAADAAARTDNLGREDALRRAMVATEYDARTPAFSLVTDSDLVIAQSPLVKYFISSHLVNSRMSASGRPIWGLAGYCAYEKTIEAPRNTLCDTLANKLLDNDDSLAALYVARAIGKKNGWDVARLQSLKDELDVFLGGASDATPGANIFSCHQLDIENKWVNLMLAKGERGMLSKRVAESGKTLAQLAAQYRIAYPDLDK